MRVGGVRGHKGLRLRGDGGKDAFLLETLAVGAAAILRSFEAGTTYLESSVFRTRQRRAMTERITLRLRQYRQAIAVRCLGAG